MSDDWEPGYIADPGSQAGRVGKLVDALGKLEDEIAKVEEHLKRLNIQREIIQRRDLPDAMTEFGLLKAETARYVCDLRFKIHGSLPADDERRTAAIDWLRENDGEDILKADVTVSFPRGDIRHANKISRVIRQHTDAETKVQLYAHHSTLAAWARERYESGEAIPFATLGLQAYNAAAVKAKRS